MPAQSAGEEVDLSQADPHTILYCKLVTQARRACRRSDHSPGSYVAGRTAFGCMQSTSASQQLQFVISHRGAYLFLGLAATST